MQIKYVKIIIIILLLFTFIEVNTCQAFLNDFNKISTRSKQREVNRMVEVTYSGLVYMRDEAVLDSKEIFSIGFPIEYKDKIVTYATLNNFTEIKGMSIKGEYFFINISNNALKEEKVILLTIFKELINKKEEKFILKIAKNPIISEEIQNLNFTIKFPSGTNVTIPKGIETLNEEETILFEKISNIPMLKLEYASIEFQSDKIIFYYIENGKLELSLNDKIIKEEITIFYNGENKINKIYVKIPRNITLIDVKDEVGSLSKTISNDEISIQLRYPISKGERASLIIIYRDEKIVNKDNEYSIHFPSFYNATYAKYTFSIKVAPSFNIKEIIPEPEAFSKELYSSIIKFDRENFIPIFLKDVIILKYSEIFSLAIFYPYLLLSLIIAIIPILIFKDRIFFGKEKLIIPIEARKTLDDLLKCFKELNEIRERIISLRKEKDLSLIRKKREEITVLRKKIKKIYPQVDKRIKKINEIDIEANKILEEFLKLEKEYRTGRISREVMSTIEKENIKRVKEMNLSIEELIEEIESLY